MFVDYVTCTTAQCTPQQSKIVGLSLSFTLPFLFSGRTQPQVLRRPQVPKQLFLRIGQTFPMPAQPLDPFSFFNFRNTVPSSQQFHQIPFLFRPFLFSFQCRQSSCPFHFSFSFGFQQFLNFFLPSSCHRFLNPPFHVCVVLCFLPPYRCLFLDQPFFVLLRQPFVFGDLQQPVLLVLDGGG